MAATYVSVAKVMPSSARIASITGVVVNDRIDLIDVLGKPAKKIQFFMTDPADVIEYTLNSLKKLRTSRAHEITLSQAEQLFGTYGTEIEEVWSGSAKFSSISSTGADVLETVDGISISSIQIDTLTLGTGSTITMVVS